MGCRCLRADLTLTIPRDPGLPADLLGLLCVVSDTIRVTVWHARTGIGDRLPHRPRSPADEGMTNVKTPVETLEVRDLEDGSTLTVHIESCTEVGNDGVPGMQVLFLGNIVCFEPRMANKLAYHARKAGQAELFLADRPWAVHENQYVKLFLVLGVPPAVRVEVKTRSKSKPAVKTYALPFSLEDD